MAQSDQGGRERRHSPRHRVPAEAFEVRNDVLGVLADLVGVQEHHVLHQQCKNAQTVLLMRRYITHWSVAHTSDFCRLKERLRMGR